MTQTRNKGGTSHQNINTLQSKISTHSVTVEGEKNTGRNNYVSVRLNRRSPQPSMSGKGDSNHSGNSSLEPYRRPKKIITVKDYPRFQRKDTEK